MGDIATPTFYLVLEKQRREAHSALLAGEQPRELVNTHGTVIVGARLQGLLDRLGKESRLRHESQ